MKKEMIIIYKLVLKLNLSYRCGGSTPMGVTPDFVCKINCTKLDIHFASNKTKMKFNKSRTDRLKLPMVSVDSATEDNQESTGFEILKLRRKKLI